MVFNFKKLTLVFSMTFLWGGSPASVAMDFTSAYKADESVSRSPRKASELYKEMLRYDREWFSVTPDVLNRSYSDRCFLLCIAASDVREGVNMLENMLPRGADINVQDPVFGYTALHWAVEAGSFKNVRIVQSGAT